MNFYEPIYDSDCRECGGTPVVGFRDDDERLRSTGLCGKCLFSDEAMSDEELWNDEKEDTE